MSRPPLLVDIQGLQSWRHGQRGIGRHINEYARALLDVPGAVDALLLNPALPLPGNVAPELLASGLLRLNTATTVRPLLQGGSAVYHILSPFELAIRPTTMIPPWVTESGVEVVVTLHDLIPLQTGGAGVYPPEEMARYGTRLELVKRASRVLTVSEHVRRVAIDALQLDPARVVSIGSGVSDRFRPSVAPELVQARVRRQLPAITRDYVFTVSGLDERKNTVRLIEAYGLLPRALRARHQLVIGGAYDDRYVAMWRSAAARAGLGAGDLVLTGPVDDSLLVSLYQCASLFVFPSLDEGFGLPVAEAVACGCAAITSNTSSLPEVLDHPDASFDPTDVAAMADAMRRALDDSGFRTELLQVAQRRGRVHRWPATVARALDAIGALHVRSRRELRRRLRVALAGPLPPAHSGIATYDLRLLEELAERCEVDAFVPDNAGGADGPAPGGVPRLPLRALMDTQTPWMYDAVVYVVGNARHHIQTWQYARHHPGVVWFHDTVLRDLWTDMARTQPDAEAFIRARLLDHYDSRLDDPAIEDWLRRTDHPHYALGLTTAWVQRARAVIVNSRLAERLLRLDQPPDAVLPAVHRLDLAVPDSRGRRATRPARPLIGSFGYNHPIKAPELLIDALAAVRRHADCGLVFVGGDEEPHRRELLQHAEAVGVREHVQFTGRVGDDEYDSWLTRVSVSVQWRRSSNGESSAAVQDAVSIGLPCITNMLGADELGGAVVALPPSAGEDELVAALQQLILDEQAWNRQRDRALVRAGIATFAAVAEGLLAVVEGLASAPEGQRTRAPGH